MTTRGPAPDITLEGADEPAPWRPGPSVTLHQGQPLPEAMVFPLAPPAEIGRVLTAASTRFLDKRVVPGWARFALVVTVGMGTWVAISLIANPATQPPRVNVTLEIVGALAGLSLAIALWLVVRPRIVLTFVGSEGIARLTLSDSAKAQPRRQVLVFSSAARLRTAATRQNMHGVYLATTYHHEWSDARNRRLLMLTGTHHSKTDQPKAMDPYWFCVSADFAWSEHLWPRVRDELAENGAVRFDLDKTRAIVLGPGFIEIAQGKKVTRLTPETIRSMQFTDTMFLLSSTDSKWYNARGKFALPLAKLPNVRVFSLLLAELMDTPGESEAAVAEAPDAD